MWNVVITLATVGYGDIYPVSFFGRTVGIIITFWGILIASMTVVIVLDYLTLNNREEKSFKMLNKLIVKSMLKQKAVAVLSKA
jgi:hypothetical protein